MGKSDAFARLVLEPGASEQLKYTLPVAVGNAPAIVADFNRDMAAVHGLSAHHDRQRTIGSPVFDGIVEQMPRICSSTSRSAVTVATPKSILIEPFASASGVELRQHLFLRAHVA